MIDFCLIGLVFIIEVCWGVVFWVLFLKEFFCEFKKFLLMGVFVRFEESIMLFFIFIFSFCIFFFDNCCLFLLK